MPAQAAEAPAPLRTPVVAREQIPAPPTADKIVAREMNFYYGAKRALENISIAIPANLVTAFIGPSGCGKSTFLRTLNRMNDIIPGARATGKIMIDGKDLYGSDVDPSPFGATSAWCFRSPTRSRSRSTTTSRMACA